MDEQEKFEAWAESPDGCYVSAYDAWFACAKQKDAEITELQNLLRKQSESAASILNAKREELAELHENLASCKLAYQAKCGAVDELCEKLAAQQICFELALLDARPDLTAEAIRTAIRVKYPCEELAAIKAAEYQAGYEEGHSDAMIGNGVTSAELAAFERGKQAGRAEIEKELMDQEPVGRVLSEAEMGIGFDRRSGPVIWIGTPPIGSIYAKPFPQQKPLSDYEIDEMQSAFVEYNGQFECDTFNHKAFARAIEAAHGITGEKK